MALHADPPATREVSVRELSRNTAGVLDDVAAGERIVVTRFGDPVALVLSVDEAIDVFLANAEEFVRMRLGAREELDRLS